MTAPDPEEALPAFPPAPRARFGGGAWMTLVALMGAGWGALLSYSAFYLTDDRPAAHAQQRQHEPEDGAFAAPRAGKADAGQEVRPGGLPTLALVVPPAADLPLVAVPEAGPAPAAETQPAPQAALVEPPQPPAAGAEDVEDDEPDYVGTWGPNPKACGARQLRRGYLPATLGPDGAKAGGTTCSFQGRRRAGAAWVVTASCRDASHRWTSQVRLLVDGDRLTWSSAKGVSNYVRCGRRQG